MQHQCHHTRNHTTPLQGQLSRKIKEKSTLLASHSHSSNVTDSGWKFPGRSSYFHSVCS